MRRLKAEIKKFTLEFKVPAATSRGSLNERDIWLLKVSLADKPEIHGLGECGPLAGLSVDDVPHYETFLQSVCDLIHEGVPIEDLDLKAYPSARFGLESALRDLDNGGRRIIANTPFSRGEKGIPINGLIWMASGEDMLRQVEDKIAMGFDCIKLKIGSLDFDEECRLLETVRKKYSAWRIELRVDANGAFHPDHALEKLRDLSRFQLHSIEQPVKAGQWELMQELCAKTRIPVALDEELIGLDHYSQAADVLKFIKPQYLIFKPSLLGGFKVCEHWIREAAKSDTGWWVTSALEGNIGLNAIAQWTSSLDFKMPQGLGTGALYKNNFSSPLVIRNGFLNHDVSRAWMVDF